jgi:hypothetical protein
MEGGSYMARRDQDYHERDPHFDSRYESVINDSTSSAGEEMGVRIDVNPENRVQAKNPFHLNPKIDKEMQKFEQVFDGNKNEDSSQ